MAAHLEGKGVGVIDMAGLAQKGGAVYSHIRIANTPEDIHAIRVAAGGADLVLGGDIVVAGNKKVLAAIKPGNTRVVVNTAEFLPGDFTRNADFSLPTERLKRAIAGAAGASSSHFVDAGAAGHRAARQFDRRQHVHARLRLSARRAAALGRGDREGDRAERRGGGDESSRRSAGAAAPRSIRPRSRRWSSRSRSRRTTRCKLSQSFDETVDAARRLPHRLSERALCAALPRAGREGAGGRSARRRRARCGLAEAVARYLFKLMAYKDEYEVARLYTDTSFVERVKSTFDGDNLRFEFHLAPPLLARARSGDRRAEEDVVRAVDADGVPACWRSSSSCAARRSTCSATPHERRTERKLIADYEALLDEIVGRADAGQSHARGRPRRHPGEDPRLRAGQGAASRRRQGRRGRACASNSAPARRRCSRPRNNLAAPLATIFRLPVEGLTRLRAVFSYRDNKTARKGGEGCGAAPARRGRMGG